MTWQERRGRRPASPSCFRPSLGRLGVLLAGCLLASLPENALSQDERPSSLPSADRHVLISVFDDSTIADNALEIHQRAVRMTADERYRYLAAWVLPGSDHDTIRTALAFTPTQPVPGEDQMDVSRLRIAEQSGQSRVQTGGLLVAPAIDLVKAARGSGELAEVRDRVDRFIPTSIHQQRSRLAMLVMVDIARGEFETAQRYLELLFSLAESGRKSKRLNRSPELLAIQAAVLQPEMHDVVRDVIYQLTNHDARSTVPGENAVWQSHMMSLMGLSSYLEQSDGSINGFGRAPALKQWSPANDLTARSRGNGRPLSHWQLTPGSIEKLAGRGTDCLYFQSPLQGNYSVECDATTYGWRDSYLLVAGTCVAPIDNLVSYRLGGVRGERSRRGITPRLARPNDWNHLRTVVRNGVSTTFMNGRQIHEEPLPHGHVPWLAIRGNGVTRNLTITGDPVIPDRLQLTAVEELPGWIPYFEESIGSPTSEWRRLGDSSDGGGIIGAHQSDGSGTFVESLLHYHRPMLEDGDIDYDFYYQAGAIETHPAIDRLAFLLEPRGVRVHWITDGSFDRTQLDPTNIVDEPENRRGGNSLPLKPDAWNSLRLRLKGDTIALFLNAQLIYERQLEPTNQRTFGVFYYSDQTELRVRNVVWRGDWPRQLPTVTQQELAGDDVEFLLARLPELVDVFEHDFTTDGLPTDDFSVIGTGWEKHVDARPDGIHVVRPGAERYMHYSIAPRLKVHGDFDITAAFDQLKTGALPNGTSGIMLTAMLDRQEARQFSINRRLLRHRGNQPIIQSGYRFLKPDGTRRDWLATQTDESTSGTLRLARRGEHVYFLFAQGDSTVFRLIGKQAISDEDLRLDDGVQLTAQTSGLGTTSVVWKSITIRAEQLTGSAIIKPEELLTEFAKQRDLLPAQVIHDFSKDDFSGQLFVAWGNVDGITPTSSGLKIVSPGTEKYSSASIASRSILRGNLDVAAEFEIVNLAMPPIGKSSSVFLQVRFESEIDERINLLFQQRANRPPRVVVQTQRLDKNGKQVYAAHGIFDAKSATEMRVVRRGGTAYVLLRESASEPYRILSEIDVGTHDVPEAGVRFDVQTGGAGLKSEVLWKRLLMSADEIIPIMP